MNQIDSLPYKTFLKFKNKYPVKTIHLRGDDLTGQGLHVVYKNHREFVEAMFRKEGVEIYRWSHNYKSLNTANPELGLVFLAGDSVIDDRVEVHALIGHNARYTSEG